MTSAEFFKWCKEQGIEADFAGNLEVAGTIHVLKSAMIRAGILKDNEEFVKRLEQRRDEMKATLEKLAQTPTSGVPWESLGL